jgi:hypothetical protein
VRDDPDVRDEVLRPEDLEPDLEEERFLRREMGIVNLL